MRREDGERGKTHYDTVGEIARRIKRATGPSKIIIEVDKLTGETGGPATRYGGVQVRVVEDESE